MKVIPVNLTFCPEVTDTQRWLEITLQFHYSLRPELDVQQQTWNFQSHVCLHVWRGLFKGRKRQKGGWVPDSSPISWFCSSSGLPQLLLLSWLGSLGLEPGWEKSDQEQRGERGKQQVRERSSNPLLLALSLLPMSIVHLFFKCQRPMQESWVCLQHRVQHVVEKMTEYLCRCLTRQLEANNL